MSKANVFFDITVQDTEKSQPVALGRIVFRLFDDIVPRTAENFRTLATRIKPNGYRGSRFHRIIPEFMLQGGDFTEGDGTGGVSIYGSKFADENFDLNHDRPFLLSMANAGKHTNGSQFFITVAPAKWLNGKHVVFGEVVTGEKVVREIEKLGSDKGPPTKIVTIQNCGLI